MNVKRLCQILFQEFPIYYIDRLASILPNNMVTCKIRGGVVGRLLAKSGRNFQLAQGSIINHPEKIIIGNNVYFAHRIYINAEAGLLVEDDVVIGPNCVIVTGNHSIKNGKVLNTGNMGEIIIGSGTWIGANVVVTDGIKIGKGCVIGAGSVVTNDVEDNTMACGCPAKIIKKLGE